MRNTVMRVKHQRNRFRLHVMYKYIYFMFADSLCYFKDALIVNKSCINNRFTQNK